MPVRLQKGWSPQQLLHMLSNTQARNKDGWKKKNPLVSSSTDIGPADRDEIVLWICQINSQFHFHPETFFLAVNILDSFITCVKAKPKYLKCIAISCLYLASKVTEEEDVIPCTGELVEDSECGCRVCDVLRMEKIILEKLSWDINSATPLDYLHIYLVLGCCHLSDLVTSVPLSVHSQHLIHQLKYLMCHYDVALFPSAVVALALLSIDLESLTQDAAKWTCISGQLQVMSKITTDELMKCRHKIMEILSDDVYDDRDDISDVGNDEKEDSSKLVYPPQHTLHHDYTHHNDVVMEDTASDGYDTDNTLTASEGEGDENQDLSKPPTYAEIVKSGKTKLEEAGGNLPCKVEEFTPPVNKRCGMQASCYFRPSSMLDVDCMRYPGEGFKLQTAK